MSFWFYIGFIWICAQLLGQAVEVGTGFTASQLTWPLLAGDTQAAVAGGDWQPAGGRIYIGQEAIDFTGVADSCPGLPALQGKCLTGLKRGLVGTTPGSYMAGSIVRGTESQMMQGLNDLRLVQTNTTWGALTFPLQAFSAFARLFGELTTWDYAYLEGNGQYLVLFMQLFNLAMLVGLARLFASPLSNLMGGIARGLTGGRFG